MARDTKERIYLAAVQLFAERGFAETSIRDIAAAAEVEPGNIYYYYDNKQVLFAQIVFDQHRGALRRLKQTAALEIKPSERLEMALRTLIQNSITSKIPSMVGEVPDLLRVMTDEHGRQYLAARRQYSDLFKGIVEEAAAAGEIEVEDVVVASKALLGMATSCRQWFRFSGRLGVEEVAEIVSRLAMRAVGAGGSLTPAGTPGTQLNTR